jgi:gas vesicle protein
MNMKTNGSNVWPYVIVGSAVGGAVGYLFMTEKGRKIRHSIAHPDELACSLEDARNFIEQKARVVTGKVHVVLDKAKQGMQEGERAYREAEQNYQSKVRQLEGKNNEIASGVHKTVDTVSRTAVTVEHSFLDPIVELGALYRGVERGIRALLGKTDTHTTDTHTIQGPTPVPYMRSEK